MQQTTVRYTLDHVVINVDDVETSTAAYRAHFGSQVLHHTSREAWLYHDDPVFLTLRQSDASPGIHHLAYRVEDATAALGDLTSKGVPVAWDLRKDGPRLTCGFRDPDGLPFEIFSVEKGEQCPPPSSRHAPAAGLRLHHANILIHDVRRSIQFYERTLGLRVALTFRPDFAGFNFLIDKAFDHRARNFMLEITGPPELDERETTYLREHGPSYDHICFITPDPTEAYRRLVAAGAPSLYEPEDFLDNVLAWVQDPQGVHVELMKPLPEELLARVLQRGPPICLSAEN